MAKVQKTDNNKVENLEELELIHLFIAGAIHNGENCFLGSQNVKHFELPHNSATLTFCIYLIEIKAYVHTKTCTKITLL